MANKKLKLGQNVKTDYGNYQLRYIGEKFPTEEDEENLNAKVVLKVNGFNVKIILSLFF